MNTHEALTASLDQHAREAQARYEAQPRPRRRGGFLGFLAGFFAGFDAEIIHPTMPQAVYVPQPQHVATPQGWDYHDNRATVAAARGEYYQVPREGWTLQDTIGHAAATSRGNAWVHGLGEVAPGVASVHYDGPGRDAWWYTSRGMQPPR